MNQKIGIADRVEKVPVRLRRGKESVLTLISSLEHLGICKKNERDIEGEREREKTLQLEIRERERERERDLSRRKRRRKKRLSLKE